MLNQLRKAQKDLKNEIVEVEAGDGAVVIQITGELKIKKVTLNPDLIDFDDFSAEGRCRFRDGVSRQKSGASGNAPPRNLDCRSGIIC